MTGKTRIFHLVLRLLPVLLLLLPLGCGGGSGALGTGDTSLSPPLDAPSPPSNAPKAQLVAAGRALENGRLARATELLKNAPTSPEKHFLEALLARQEGRFADAIHKLNTLAGLDGPLEVVRLTELAAIQKAAGDHEGSLVTLERLLLHDSLDEATRKSAMLQKGETLLSLEQWDRARSVFETARAGEIRARRKEALALPIARCLLAQGRKEAAKTLLAPLLLSAKRKKTMLQAETLLDEAQMAPTFNDAEHLARAQRFLDLKAWSNALDEADILIKTGRKNLMTEEAAWIRAQVFFKRRGHYREALAALKDVIARKGQRKEEAEFLLARAHSRLDEDETAIALYKKFAPHWKDTKQATTGLFYAGRLEYYLGKHHDAVTTLEGLVGNPLAGRSKKTLRPSSRRDAHFLAGLSLFLEGQFKRAAAHFEAASKGSTHREAIMRNAYWRALATLHTAPEKGEKQLHALCAPDGTTWYARWAATRLAEHNRPQGPCELSPLTRAVQDADPIPLEDDLVALIDRVHPVAGFLTRAGLFRRAGELLAGIKTRTVEGWNTQSQIALFTYLGMPHKAIRLAGDLSPWPPSLDNAWKAKVAYPTPKRELVHKMEAHHALPSHLIVSIARKESLFDPKAVSSVGAMGLMQMMPHTYEVSRKKAGLPPLAPNTLPSVDESIRAASEELAHLTQHYQSLPLAIMAYNGGMGAVNRWLERSGDLPMDVFVEKAGFGQTRNYVRRVWRNLVRYRLLDGAAPPTLPKTAKRLEDS